jgi:GNAT superfamily N-acetyltransferase
MAEPYRIRPASADDIAFLTEVSLEATRAQGRLAADVDEAEWHAGFGAWHRELLEDGSSSLSVVEVDGRPAGRLRVSRTPEAIQLNGIQLHPTIQNRGIGTAIITELQSEAASTGVPLDLGVERDNPDARRLYDRLGFRRIGGDDTEDKLRWLSPAAARQNEIWTRTTS